MIAVYHVPDYLPAALVASLAADDLRPGDDVVIEDGRPPHIVRPTTVDVTRYLPALRLRRLVHDSQDMPGADHPGPHLRVVQGGA